MGRWLRTGLGPFAAYLRTWQKDCGGGRLGGGGGGDRVRTGEFSSAPDSRGIMAGARNLRVSGHFGGCVETTPFLSGAARRR